MSHDPPRRPPPDTSPGDGLPALDDAPQSLLGRILFGAALAAGAAFFLHDALGNAPLMADYRRDPGPAFEPMVTLVLMEVAGVYLLAEGLIRQTRRGWGEVAPWRGASTMILPALMVVTLIGFVLVVPLTGFLFASLVLSVSWALVITRLDGNERLSTRMAVAAGGTAFAAVAMILLFKEAIGVPLP